MAFTLEQEMITIIQSCVETSQLKSDRHLELDRMGYLNWELFNGESWSIRHRNEVTSKTKRTYLNDMVDILVSNHNAMVARAKSEKEQYQPDAKEKTKSRIVEEVNLQIAHFNTLKTILAHYRKQVEATIAFNAQGGESLTALIKCETILEGAISGWIAQMQRYDLHTKGVFPIIFTSSKTRSAGTLFNDYVRGLIADGEALARSNKRDPFASGDDTSGIKFDIDVTGLYERASLNGDRPKAPVGQVVCFSTPKSSRILDTTSSVFDTASAPPGSPKLPSYYVGKIDDVEGVVHNPFEEKGNVEKIKKPMQGKF